MLYMSADGSKFSGQNGIESGLLNGALLTLVVNSAPEETKASKAGWTDDLTTLIVSAE